MDKVRFGVIGCGYFGGELARIIKNLEDAEMIAVHGGSRAQSLAEELGCEVVDSLEALVSREDLDAVIVVNPSHVHKEAAIQAARQGKHVFCEKPIALSSQDCHEMLEACQGASVQFMAGHIMHFMNGIETVKRLIAEGRIGTPIICHAERTGWEERQTEVSWKKNSATSGGHVFHHIHELDFLQAVLGPASYVFAAGGNLAHVGEGYGDEEDVILLTMGFPNGALATMQYGSGFRWGEHYIKINGTEGAILVDMKQSRIELRQQGQVCHYGLNHSPEADFERAESYRQLDGGIVYGTASSKLPRYLAEVMRKEMAVFRDAVLGRPVPEEYKLLLDGTAARSSIATAEAAMKSIRERTIIPIIH